jgi:phage terminase large subunit-like protein
MGDRRTVTTRGVTLENRNNLAPGFLQQIIDKYEGTRLGRQELNAEVLDDVIGGLWTRANIDENRKRKDELPELKRIVISVDPALKASGDPAEGEEGAETGIVAAGLGVDGRGYVLGDWSCRLGPDGWARRAIAAYDEHGANLIVAERNQGGEMVGVTIRSVRNVPLLLVWSGPGKTTRAEPVAALYEQGRISHVGSHPILEDQMMLFTQFGIEKGTTGDRVDALVWAFTHLFPQIITHKEQKIEKKTVDRWDRAFSRQEREIGGNIWKGQ